MKITFTGAAAVTAALLVCSIPAMIAQTGAGSSDRMNNGSMGNMSSADRNFMMKAAQGGMAEVQLGETAQNKASSEAVKAFGKRMVDDHSKANDELKQLASQKNVTLPTEVDAKDKATMDRLSAMSGAAFDKAYMRDMVTDHKHDIAEFQREANSGKDPDVKAWAQKTLPVLQTHLSLAESTQQQVMGRAAGKAGMGK